MVWVVLSFLCLVFALTMLRKAQNRPTQDSISVVSQIYLNHHQKILLLKAKGSYKLVGVSKNRMDFLGDVHEEKKDKERAHKNVCDENQEEWSLCFKSPDE